MSVPEPKKLTRRGRIARWLAAGAAGVALLLALAYIGICLMSAERLTRPKNRPARLAAGEVDADAVPWSARAEDGLTLRGWYLPTGEKRRLVVLVHGLWMTWEDHVALGRNLHARGYDVLMFNLRGHGQSDPARLSMGGDERRDVRAILAWARDQGFTPDRIGWLGQSLGASTLLMEAADNPELRVVAIDSSFTNLPEILKIQLSRHSHLPAAFNPGILAAARLVYGLDAAARRPIDSARRWDGRPLLLLHCEEDATIPVRHTHELAAAAGPVAAVKTFPGLDHIDAHRLAAREYLDTVDAFFRSHLAGGPVAATQDGEAAARRQ